MIPRGTQVVQFLEKYGLEDQFDFSILSSESFTADHTTEKLTIADEYKLGDIITLSGITLPAGLAFSTQYYVIPVTATTIRLASSLSNALMGVYISFTTDGTAPMLINTLTYKFIQDRIDRFIVPWVQRKTRCNFNGVRTVTEYYSGNGSDILVLNRRNINEVTAIAYVSGNQSFTVSAASIELIATEGILKARTNAGESMTLSRTFPRGTDNIKITYTYGYDTCPDDIYDAILYLAAEQALGQLANRTGGGDISTQGWSRSWGGRSKYTHERNDLRRQAIEIIRGYMTGVVGA